MIASDKGEGRFYNYIEKSGKKCYWQFLHKFNNKVQSFEIYDKICNGTRIKKGRR